MGLDSFFMGEKTSTFDWIEVFLGISTASNRLKDKIRGFGARLQEKFFAEAITGITDFLSRKENTREVYDPATDII